ncbi:Biofilm-induced protein [Candida albicans P76067]|nr:Biofilm-induced protein [Candida albicans P76067]KHC28978.1 Biofilm-induced protein [Candida albicans P76055]
MKGDKKKFSPLFFFSYCQFLVVRVAFFFLVPHFSITRSFLLSPLPLFSSLPSSSPPLKVYQINFFSFLQNSDHSLCPPASPRFSHQILFFQQTFLLSPLFSSAHFYYHNYNQSFGTRTHPIHPQSFDTTHI